MWHSHIPYDLVGELGFELELAFAATVVVAVEDFRIVPLLGRIANIVQHSEDEVLLPLGDTPPVHKESPVHYCPLALYR